VLTNSEYLRERLANGCLEMKIVIMMMTVMMISAIRTRITATNVWDVDMELDEISTK